MIRAVLDANVFVSGILSAKTVPGTILKTWRNDQFHLAASLAILDELDRVLRYPKIARLHGWSAAEVADFVEDIAGLAIMTPGKVVLAVIAGDPSDNRYLECAVESQADCIVTGDHHLKDLVRYQEIEILSPREFAELLQVC
jgi:putative PIN family toxin of toxin-antitoxin system